MPTAVTTRKAPPVEGYFSAVRDANPFTANRVTEPSAYDVDVPAIHAASFDRLVALAGKAKDSPRGIGVALLGGAGVGKSHLLSRLYRWAHETAAESSPNACYVYLHNILADPDRLPRYLLKYVVSRLSNGGQGPLWQTRLFGFIDRAMRGAAESSGLKVDRIEDNLRPAVDAYLEAYAGSPDSRTIHVTLLQFWRFARPVKADDPRRRLLASAALAWLSGDEVDPALAAHLGFKAEVEKAVMLADDQQVRDVLRTLIDLARVNAQPFILCIDQFENLDPEKIKPFSRFLHALLDHASNLLVITSGVKQTLLQYKEENIIPEASWDRIAEYTVEPKRLTRSEARKVLEARLERFHDPFLEQDQVRRRVHEDTLFPLGSAWLEKQLADGLEFRARDILNWARDAWEDEQHALAEMGGRSWIEVWPRPVSGSRGNGVSVDIEALIDAAVESKLEELVAQHRLQPGSLPPDAGNLAGLVESLLGHCTKGGWSYTFTGLERPRKKGSKLPPYDLLVRERRQPDGREVRTGVAFVTTIGVSAAAALRRLLRDDTTIDHRMLVTDQERRPLKVGAQGADHYKGLERLGPTRFEHVKLNFEQYARLDALQGVIGLARSGDLEIEPSRGTTRPVTESEVIASHHRRDRFRRHPLLRPLLTEESPSEPSESPTKTHLRIDRVRQYIMAQLAWRMGSTTQALARGFVEEMPEPRPAIEEAWVQFKAIAGALHAEGLVHATPQDNDLFLLLRK